MSVVVPLESAKAAAQVGPERVGVLLVNLGTPDTADARGVRVYLKEFLSDPRVIEDQGLLWKLALNGIILRRRPSIKARDYLKIWNMEKDESPLKTITRSQSDKLAAAISDHDHVVIDWAMRYGNPSIKSRIEALTAQGCERLLVVPRWRRLLPGDLVALRDPDLPERLLIKRVDKVTRDGVIVRGDNPSASRDSRDFGAVTLGSIVGLAVYRYHPADRAGGLAPRRRIA